jgi:hypothetical protein
MIGRRKQVGPWPWSKAVHDTMEALSRTGKGASTRNGCDPVNRNRSIRISIKSLDASGSAGY